MRKNVEKKGDKNGDKYDKNNTKRGPKGDKKCVLKTGRKGDQQQGNKKRQNNERKI